jgi:hypothetical protein
MTWTTRQLSDGSSPRRSEDSLVEEPQYADWYQIPPDNTRAAGLVRPPGEERLHSSVPGGAPAAAGSEIGAT